MPFKIDVNYLDASQGFTMVGHGYGGETGKRLSGAGDVNGDGIDDIIIGAKKYEQSNSTDWPGVAYVIYGQSGADRLLLDLALITPADGFAVKGTDDVYLGASVSAAGDVNDDGIADLVIGARYYSDSYTKQGASFVAYGQSGSTRETLLIASLTESEGFGILGEAPYDLS